MTLNPSICHLWEVRLAEKLELSPSHECHILEGWVLPNTWNSGKHCLDTQIPLEMEGSKLHVGQTAISSAVADNRYSSFLPFVGN